MQQIFANFETELKGATAHAKKLPNRKSIERILQSLLKESQEIKQIIEQLQEDLKAEKKALMTRLKEVMRRVNETGRAKGKEQTNNEITNTSLERTVELYILKRIKSYPEKGATTISNEYYKRTGITIEDGRIRSYFEKNNLQSGCKRGEAKNRIRIANRIQEIKKIIKLEKN